MPTYDYACTACDTKETYYRRLAELEDPVQCPSCGELMYRAVSAPMISRDYEPYNCPITGKRITGKREHIENLKRHGCRVYEPGETQEAMKRAKEREEAADREVERIVEAAAQDMGYAP